MGASNAWGGEQIIFSQDFELLTNSTIGDYVKSTSLQNGISIETQNGYGNYLNFNLGNNNGRTWYYRWYTSGNDNYGEQTVYTMEFDATLTINSNNANSQSGMEMVVVADGGSFPTNNNNAYGTSGYLFKIKQTVAKASTFQINDAGDAIENFPTEWLHYKLSVDGSAGTVDYIITDGTTTVATGTYSLPSGVSYKAQGFHCLSSRYNSVMKLDNIKVYYETDEDVANAPSITLSGINGKERTYIISFTNGETLHYILPGEEEATVSTGSTKTVSTSTSGTLKAWTTNGSATSSEVTETVSAEDITLNKPWIWISSIATNGSYYNLTLDGDQNQSSVLLSPTATLTATFIPDGGTASVVTLPYTATSKGTLTVTSSAKGYTSASVTFNVEALYEQTWQSLDFSSLIGTEAVQAALGDSWTQQTGHGRWASWNKDKDGSYNFYQHGEGTANNITVNDKIKMREVVLLAEGMGLGRNTSGGEAISVVSSTDDIVAFEIYNGYGNDINKGTNTYMQYAMNTSGNPSMNSTNGALLVQATVYSPASYTLTDGSAVRLTFKNATAGTGTAYGENFKIDFYNSSSEKVANVRADWWDDVANTNGLYTYGYTHSSDGGLTADNSNVWATYMSDMTNADIDLTMSYSGGNLYVIGTMTNGQKVYYVNYKKDGLVGDLTYNLYGNNASLSNISVASASVVTTPAHPDNVAVTLGSNGYTTYANNVYPLDLSNAKAYKAAVDGNAVKFTLFEQAVPAGTGMLVEGEKSGAVNLPIADASTDVSGNEFLVNAEGNTFNADGNATYYAMKKDSSPLKFGTFNPSTLAFPATKAYLKVAGGVGAKALTAFFGGDVTGISQVENAVQKTDGAVYNIAGQRVSKPTKGLYIVNGKKVMVK